MSIKTYILSVVILLVTVPSAIGQYLNPIYTDRDTFRVEHENTLLLRLQNVNYFKNNEYFGEVIPGYTLPGLDFTPALVYFPTKTVKIEAGFQYKKIWGENEQMKQASLLRFHWMLHDGFSLVIGNLYSHNSHNLPEPIMNPERSFYSLRDQGVQLLIRRPMWDVDAWVSWDKFIWFRDKYNEKVWGGLSSKFKLSKGDNHFHIPLYVTADHNGGQIDATLNPATTELNIGSGLHYKRQLAGWLQNIEFSSELFTYGNDFPQNYDLFSYRRKLASGVYPFVMGNGYSMYDDEKTSVDSRRFNHGYAALSRAVFRSKNWEAALGYWYGYNYYSPRGEYVYHNKSPFNNAVRSERDFAHLHAMYNTDLKDGIQLAVAFDTYYLIKEAKTDFSMGIYLFFNRDFFIGKFKHIQQ